MTTSRPVQHPEVRVIAVEYGTETRIAELRPLTYSYGHKLNDAGEASLRFAVTDTAAAARLREATAGDGRVELYIDRDGTIVWGGVPWHRKYHATSRELEVTCSELWTRVRKRKIVETLAFVDTDQLEIVEGIIDHLQAQVGGDMGLQVVFEPSGRERDRTYYAHELKDASEAVEQLAAVIDGFDFAIDPIWVDEEIVRRLILSYPRRGRTASQSRLVFETKRDLAAFDLSEDGWRSVNRYHAIGAGEAESMLIATASRTDKLDAGIPLMEGSNAWTDVSVLDTLSGHANQAVNDLADVVTTPTIELLPTAEQSVGSWIVGDDARIRLVDDPWAGDVDLFVRIVADEVKGDATGTETVSLTVSGFSG